MQNDQLIIAGKAYSSRLLVGTGKYQDFAQTRAAIEASGARSSTVAIRRTNIGQEPGQPSLLDYLPPSKYTLLPIPPAATRQRTPCVRCAWRASCSTATTWSSWKCWRRADAVSRHAADAGGGRNAGGRTASSDGVLRRRSHPGEAPGGNRLRGGDAAGLADRPPAWASSTRGTCA